MFLFISWVSYGNGRLLICKLTRRIDFEDIISSERIGLSNFNILLNLIQKPI